MRRRHFLGSALATLATPSLARTLSTGLSMGGGRRHDLVARHSTEPLVGMPYPPTPVWAFGGDVPGPALRLRLGDPVSLAIVNELDVPTSVHWHGIRVPWAMDGVAGLTQPPIQPGERFHVDFVPPDAGTYWYHAHANTPEQVGRGLYGPLIVEEVEPIDVDRELIWVLDDWRLGQDATIVEGFDNRHDASHGGRLGNTITLNGRLRPPIRVQSGERLRLRLINAANARQFALDFGDLPLQIIAIDGQPVRPHTPDGLVSLPSAGRVDLIIDLLAPPSETLEVIDRYYREPSVVGALALDAQRPLRSEPPDTPIDLGTPSLPEPDLRDALALDVAMRGGAMRGLHEAVIDGEPRSGRELAASGHFWALNDLVANGYDTAPLLVVERGRTVHLRLRNDTAFVHPMHLHGHHVKLLSVDGRPPARDTWHDSVPVAPDQDIEMAFVADNPGRWLFHCHVLEHHMAGMGTIVQVD